MMKDVTSRLTALMVSSGLNEDVPSAIPGAMKGRFLDVPGPLVLDKSNPDGIVTDRLAFDPTKFEPGGDIGQIFAFERDTGSTRLFLAWIPSQLLRDLRTGRPQLPYNFHVLFHPPTYENCYRNTQYWYGLTSDARGENCDAAQQNKPLYVKLGLRYLWSDFRAIAQHIVAGSTGLRPNMVYVIPVADINNFGDLIQPSVMILALSELLEAALVSLSSTTGQCYGDTSVGRVMLSGYSHSGTIVETMFSNLRNSQKFFKDHLGQVNLFDIVLNDRDRQDNEDRVVALCESMLRLQQTTSNVRVMIYTAYSSIATKIRLGRQGAALFSSKMEVNFEDVPWSDSSLKATHGISRGGGVETVSGDGRVSLLLIPVQFFRLYIPTSKGPVKNDRGFDHIKLGHGHGHGWFLRALMAHALSHADPNSFYVKRAP